MKRIYLALLSMLCCIAHQSIAQTFNPIDVWPGPGNGHAYAFVPFNGKVYFQAADSLHGYELWSTDGTQAGTTLIKDIWEGPEYSNPFGFTEFNGKLLLSASDSLHGNEIWITDGTTAGTTMLLDINPGSGDSYPAVFTVFNGKIYFIADDGTHGGELWVTDGTPAGTAMIKDINPGISGSGISNGYAPYDFYVTQFTPYNGKLYFGAEDGTHGTELWSTDGTTLGTTMVADINPGSNGSGPIMIWPFNGKLYFSAADAAHGRELWTSDGTAANTVLLKDINSGPVGSLVGNYSHFTEYNGKLYFGAADVATGIELWSTDGTSLGTALVKDILPGPGSSAPGIRGIFVFKDKLFFDAGDSINGAQLWTSDGTAGGTTLFTVLSTTTPYASNPGNFIYYNGQMIFQCHTSDVDGVQLWTSDGTAAGTHIIAPAIAPNHNPLEYNYGYSSYAILNNTLFFDANFNTIGDEVWTYTLPTTSITDVSGTESINVYPNPFDATITVDGLDANDTYHVRVSDIAGRECYTSVMSQIAEKAQITMPYLSSGIYLIQVEGQRSKATFKMVKN